MLFDDRKFFIGDTCKIFSTLKGIRSFYNNASLDINIIDIYDDCYSLLKNNHHVGKLTNTAWHSISFECYDLVLCFCPGEPLLKEMLAARYRPDEQPQVLSLTTFNGKNFETAFSQPPGLELFFEQMDDTDEHAVIELFMGEEEKVWGDSWLQQQGVLPGAKVIVLPDSASNMEKVLPFWSRIQLFNYFLTKKDTWVLIFDEQNSGKKEYYRKLLSPAIFSRLIVAEGLSLREEISILSSSFIKMIFGPCTGLLHCATGIYTTFMNNGMPASEVPLMLVYGGTESGSGETNKWYWWKYTLVDCLVLDKDAAGGHKIVQVTKDHQHVSYPCSLFTAPMLISYLENHYSERLAVLGIN